MREGFKTALLELGADPKFQVLTGDHGYALFDEFRERFPEQFHNVGVAETSLVTMAAGLVRGGYTPLIYALSSFMPSRVFEFLKLQVALDALPVIVIGDGGGVVYSQLGHSHQSLDDLALANLLPNFQVFSPSGDEEMKRTLHYAASSNTPSYIRIGKTDGGFMESFEGSVPHPYLIRNGSGRNAIIAHGSMTSRILRLDSSQVLEADMWSCPTISNLPSHFVESLKRDYDQVCVVEEHIAQGGLGSALRDMLYYSKTKVHLISATKEFHEGIGSYEWTLDQRGIGDNDLETKISAFLR